MTLTHKAISIKHECDSWYESGYVELDLDRFIDYMKYETQSIRDGLNNPKGTMYEDEGIAHHMESHMESYDGLLRMILANEFR